MSKSIHAVRPGAIIGHRRNGTPIHLLAGGAPTLLEQARARLVELQDQRAQLVTEQRTLLTAAEGESRGLNDTEQTSYDDLARRKKALDDQHTQMGERVAELQDEDRRDAAAATVRGARVPVGDGVVTDPEVYVRGGGTGNSFWRDMARRGLDPRAADRLARSTRATLDAEQRALGNTGAVGGSGGELAPPQWLVEDYIDLARAGRVTADLMQHSDVPVGVSSVNLPKILTGTAVAIQSTQNTALAQTDLTTGFVQTGFTTTGGKQVVAQQLLDQTAIDFDQVITSDLAGAYAQQVGSQVINGAGTGTGTAAVVNGLVVAGAQAPAVNQVAFTSAAATAGAFYSKAAGMLAAFMTTRFVPPTGWLMHPRRWYWLMAQTDANQRPLVVPQGAAYNPVAVTSGVPAAGMVGTFLGLPVYIDPNVPTTQGAGNNQDEVFLAKWDDLWFFESPVRAESFNQTYADSVGVLFRLYAYVGAILNRRSASVATMTGTGLAAPAF